MACEPTGDSGLLHERYTRSVRLDGGHPPERGPEQELTAPMVEVLINERHLPPRYRVARCIGRGSSSRVFQVHDLELGRDLAVKVLRWPISGDDELIQHYRREVQVAALVQHPAVVPIHDTGIGESGWAWVSMGMMTGTTLRSCLEAWQEAGAPPASIAGLGARVHIIIEVANALAHAHERGVVHHDVKPGNIMLGRHGEIALVDWGGATTSAERAQGMAPHIGTPAYMAPEQARGEVCDARADCFSLGATCFHLLYGRAPLLERDPERHRVERRRGGMTPPTAREVAAVPRELRAIVARCLQADPDARYQDLVALRADLQRWQDGEAVQALPEGWTRQCLRRYRRRPVLWWTGACTALLVVLLIVSLWTSWLRQWTGWQVLAVDDFHRADVGERWSGVFLPAWRNDHAVDLPADGNAVRIRNGGLELHQDSSRQGCVNAVHLEALPADVRIQWRATPLVEVVNVNCFIGAPDRQQAFVIHVGGFNRVRSVVLSMPLENQQMIVQEAMLPQMLRAGTSHAMRLERRDDMIRFWIDGKLLLDFRDPAVSMHPTRDHFGFETAGNAIRIEDVRIEHLPLPRMIAPIVLAHRAYKDGDLERALVDYRRLARQGSDAASRAEAAFHLARCLWRLQRVAEARQAFLACLDEPAAADRHVDARYHLARIAFEGGDLEQADRWLQEVADTMTPDHPLRAASS
ncbi:MAG: protein kinase domain-containing protein, partial [Planctomycetota bacterium]